MSNNTRISDFFLKGIQFILFGNVFIALGALLVTQATYLILGLSMELFVYPFLVFFSTLFIYNLQRSFYKTSENASLNSVRRTWININQKAITALALIGLIGIIACLFFIPIQVIYYLSPLLIISVAYFLPVLKLRKYAWVKLLTLVLVWTIVTAVVPIVLNHETLSGSEITIHLFSRACFMMGICIPFDIRDIRIDNYENISTIPQSLGESVARYIAIGFMVSHILLILAGYKAGFTETKIFIALIVSALINTIFVAKAHSKRSEYFYVAGIDGTLIIQGTLLLIAQHLF